ncbi:tyrosine-type recombinase/integrase [Actinophytocola sp.]|uniref:tyrosine-type recombinase/integrase n=1 Tax=Actinophytocola sp. TaxID=1872138 RepID=UPI003D6B6F24
MAWVERRGAGFRVRYRLPDGTLTSETGFDTWKVAADRAADVECEQRNGTLVDPRLTQTLVGEWVRQWSDAHEVGAGTWAKYDSHLRNHILPRFGDLALGEVTRMAVKAWVKSLRRSLAEPTVIDVVSLLSMVLVEAVEEGLIGVNPCRRLRLRLDGRTERPHARPEQVAEMVRRVRPADGVLIITAAYTGMRWGELTGLQWTRVNLDAGEIAINPRDGALHEVNGQLTLARPKTRAAARTIHLPAFLVEILTAHRHQDPDGRFVFTAADGGFHRRSNFRRRVWLPAVDGHPTRGWAPIAPGLHVHDLRHTHKTWLIEDQVPEVLQSKRLGHELGGIPGVFSHVTPPMIDAMLDGLQRRWEQYGSTALGDLYHAAKGVKINCTQSAPTDAERPAGDDHQQAV